MRALALALVRRVRRFRRRDDVIQNQNRGRHACILIGALLSLRM